ncbi:MAG: tRNA 4-thiouridine(8) synthase ThiI [Tenericutes bacterium]|nr:tRNA 4-thiouridine(8) synthase ThiI [Mycoplasmatota bacterium]
MKKLIMIKYGELTTKKANRKIFITMLENNIKKILSNLDYKIKKDRVRMYIESDSIELVEKKLKKIFGIHSIVECYQVNTNIEEIETSILSLLPSEGKTFKVNTKRADKTFPIPSMDFNNKIGGFILKNTSLKVDVHNPDIMVHIEIRVEGTFLYFNEMPGLGGYPVGIQGKGLLMLSGGIDSPVAGYLALKRGIDLDCLYFESPPHTSVEAKNKVIKLASIINEYSGNIRVFVLPFTEIQEEIYKNVDDSYIITIMRRFMYRIAERLAHKYQAKIIVNGESVGQVASQTLASMSVINAVTCMPVIRPVACLDKLEIIEIAKKIETYETSILPYEDCCTIFLPKHPVIHPNLEKVLSLEKKLNIEELIDRAIEKVEIISSLNEEKHTDLL